MKEKWLKFKTLSSEEVFNKLQEANIAVPTLSDDVTKAVSRET